MHGCAPTFCRVAHVRAFVQRKIFLICFYGLVCCVLSCFCFCCFCTGSSIMQVIQSATPPAYINAAAPENTALAGTILVITADAARIHPQLAHIFLDRWRVRRPYRRRWGWCWGHHANAEKGLKFCCKLLGGFCDRRSGSRSRRSSRSTNAKQFLKSPGKHLHLLCRTPCFCATGACMTTPAATSGTSRRRLHCRNVWNVGRMRKKGGRPGAQAPPLLPHTFQFFQEALRRANITVYRVSRSSV